MHRSRSERDAPSDEVGGVVATTMWGRLVPPAQWLVDAAIAIDPTVNRSFGRRASYGSAEALSDLLTGAGVTDMELTDFDDAVPVLFI